MQSYAYRDLSKRAKVIKKRIKQRKKRRVDVIVFGLCRRSRYMKGLISKSFDYEKVKFKKCNPKNKFSAFWKPVKPKNHRNENRSKSRLQKKLRPLMKKAKKLRNYYNK